MATDFLKRAGRRIRKSLATIRKLDERLDEIRINQGIIFSRLNRDIRSTDLKDYEFKVFSQWGDDGIIQQLVRSVEIKNKTFIEFGVEDFFESNCRFLLMKDDWNGFVIDGSRDNIARLQQSYFYRKHHLIVIDAFITRENINALLARSGFDDDLGLLSIDTDGNDYFVLEAIESFRPRILILEFNSVFGAARKISVPCRADFQRTQAHHSNLYFGASLGAVTHLAGKKGYTLVGTNSAGVNAFYVRNDLLDGVHPGLTVEDAYVVSNSREARDESGNLACLAGTARLEAIRGLPVFNVETETLEAL